MILELDVGNTRIKWRELAGDERKDGGLLLPEDTAAMARLRKKGEAAELIRVSNVAGFDVAQLLQGWWGENSQAKLCFAATSTSCAGVINSYSDPTRMGVDRWLAMVAAYAQCADACCVIDCGSAITVDVVEAQGRHRGGYIVPGLCLLKQSLLQDTQDVKFDFDHGASSTALGRSTAEAVNHGVFSMTKSWLNEVVEDFLSDYPSSGDAIYITGGDAQLFGGHLTRKLNHKPELVLDGLKLVIV